MYQRTVLSNGTRVVTEYIPYVRSVSLGVWLETGSRDENQEQLGFSHFIEHMMFKGSEKFTARDIAELMDTSGGHLNAFTAKEHTCYYARFLDEHFALATDILQQMLLKSLFAVGEIDKERGVVLEEIKMYEDTPDELVHDLFCEVLWPDHALGRSVLGTSESIRKATREELLDYVSSCYTTDRLVIAAAGNMKHSQVVAFAQAFDQLQHHSPNWKIRPKTATGQQLIRVKDTEQVHLCLGGEALCRRDERKYALYLLDTITGGGMSSRLFQELREERGLVYSTYSYHSSYQDIGSFGIYAGCSGKHVNEVINVIEHELVDLAGRQIDSSELNRAKSQLKGSLMLAMESTTNRMTRLAKGEMNYGKLFTPDEVMAAIDDITEADIQALASELYNPDSWSLAAVGPVSELRRAKLCQKIG